MDSLFYFYLFFAVIGGTVFVAQFALSVIGLGAHDLDLGSVHDLAGDVPDDIPGELTDAMDAHGSLMDHGSTWLFGVLSFRTVVAAMTFFGLAGVASIQAGLQPLMSVLIALVCGAVAMYGVHFLMRSLHRLRQDGTARIERAVGERGKVYLPIPPDRAGTGQVQIHIQGRLMEYTAMTDADIPLATGTVVVVTEVVSPDTVRVQPLANEKELPPLGEMGRVAEKD